MHVHGKKNNACIKNIYCMYQKVFAQKKQKFVEKKSSISKTCNWESEKAGSQQN